MTKTEIAQLLTLIAAFDRRTIGEADVEAWNLILADLDVEDCMTAVREHYTESRDWIMPADVYRRATLAQRRREGEARRAALEAQIAAENPGAIAARPIAALTVGKPIPADDPVRTDRRRQLQAAAHTKRESVEADTAARAEQQRRKAEARAELEAQRQTEATDGTV